MSADAATLKPNKQLRRRWMTFLRMVRYGVNNFSRNAWLTTAAMAVMTVTLFIILATYLAHNIFNDTVADLRSKVEVSIFLRNDVPAGDVKQMQSKLLALHNVQAVRYISPQEAQTAYNAQNNTDAQQLQDIADITKDTGPLVPSSFRVEVKDLGKVNEIKDFVNKDQLFQRDINSKVPNYGGDRQGVIDNIARTANFAEKLGLGASILFVVISTLIIFNTIRMAIFNRREEIQMMKLIGADKGFIRGPFIVEAVMYGFFAALVSVGLVYAALFSSQDKLMSYGVNTAPTIDLMQHYPSLILLAAIVVGAILGIISSQLAVRRYLKV